MADIRLSKIIRQFNIGLDILVDFLHRQGVEVEANPNAKVSDELLPAIGKQFGKDLELKQAADKVDVNGKVLAPVPFKEENGTVTFTADSGLYGGTMAYELVRK